MIRAMQSPEELAKARRDAAWSELNMMHLAGATPDEVARRRRELMDHIEKMDKRTEEAADGGLQERGPRAT